MRLLFVGDIVGIPGRRAAQGLIPGLRRRLGLDAVVVNSENAADDGKGLTPAIAEDLLEAGADVLTGGNHVFADRSIETFFARDSRLIRPANRPGPGTGAVRLELAGGLSLGVVQVEGRVFMRGQQCPFAAAREALEGLGPCTATMVDFHAEASSEKQALGYFLDGKTSAVLGTHTHVSTADAQILPHGTAYMTDVGMTGAFASVIGMGIEAAVARFVGGTWSPHEVACDDVRLCGVVVEVDNQTGRAVSIERLEQSYDGERDRA